ncbi:threonine/serine exporter family protein [Streptomyces sp. R302]|uniref:threonine/serine ThrE exporter family protein n=1 Tax=unclassified Streptomyces TaxID=2593676 RepID=UPI00145DEDC4|nr:MULTISPECIES: threonine/serine exporter family protein [unclassified Streptomyces]NML51913.1 threonine/serine exporter family protein [Streptomyces sp. R301]NML81533.1 threonine/serine exporter family protein [Streptomyces sp. R302]
MRLLSRLDVRGLARRAAALRPRRRTGTVTLPEDDTADRERLRDLASLLCELGSDLLRAAERSSEVERTLHDVAARYGTRARCFVVPTGLFVRVGGGPDGRGGELDFAPVEGPDLRLDQVEALQALVGRMLAEEVPFGEVRRALRENRERPDRFSPAATVFGYVLLTVGLGTMRHATVPAVAGYAVLGAGVGLLRLFGDRLPAARTALPVVTAILVTAAALRWAGPLLHENPAVLYIPPLIAFLPGAALTLGAIELATGAALSGLSRLAGALTVLLLLSLGILVGSELLRPRPSGGKTAETLGHWAPWVGVLLLGFGFLLYFSAPPRVTGWLLGALLVERLVQSAASELAGAAFGAFAAGAVLPPMATWIEKRSRTPDQVVFLPCFWLLVPGAVGLTSVSEIIVEKDTGGGLNSLVGTVITVAAIALGVLVGAGLQRRPRLMLGEPAPSTPEPVRDADRAERRAQEPAEGLTGPAKAPGAAGG